MDFALELIYYFAQNWLEAVARAASRGGIFDYNQSIAIVEQLPQSITSFVARVFDIKVLAGFADFLSFRRCCGLLGFLGLMEFLG